MHWFKDGDQNSNFFHSYMKGRKKLEIYSIEDSTGRVLTSSEKIGKEAVKIFQDQFIENNANTNYEELDIIPYILTEEDRSYMEKWPEEDEIREAVFYLNKDSASEPDGFSGEFYQVCWDIIKEEVLNVVKFFFCDTELP